MAAADERDVVGRTLSDDAGQWLLGEAEPDGVGHARAPADKGDRPPRRRQAARWSTGRLLLVLFLAALFASTASLLLLVKIALVDGPARDAAAAQPPQEAPADDPPAQETPIKDPPTQHPPAPPTFRRPDTDYVLDPAWDMHAPPTVREFSWVIENVEANPDGVFRPMTLINGQFPGELIRCNEGDTIVVTVENRAANATAIHWHGLFQNGTNHMDGTPGATQCPIAPGRSFRYEFAVRGQAGTYFYHGHQGADALDGLVGPIVVHSPAEAAAHQDLLPYETDRVVLVQDWYHDPASTLLVRALEPGAESAPLPNGALINGANAVDCDRYRPLGRRCDNSTARLPALDLAAGQRHRLRFVHVGAFAWLELTLDRHHQRQLHITEVDGVAVAPVPETHVLLAPGQRYSVVLAADDASVPDRAYWLRARIATHCFAEHALADADRAEARAIVRYTDTGPVGAGEAGADPDRLPSTAYDNGAYTVVCRDMTGGGNGGRGDGDDGGDDPFDADGQPRYRPVPAVAAPAHADHTYAFRLNLEIHGNRLQRGYFNGSSYRPNLGAPALHRAIDGLQTGNASFAAAAVAPDGVNDVAFDRAAELVLTPPHAGVRVVDFAVQNFDEGAHPLHLHGHQVFVLGAGHGYFPGYAALGLRGPGTNSSTSTSTSSSSARLANPVRRDVASVEGFGWTLLRVVLDNPGVWKLHCHMVWHGDGGMALLVLARPDLLQAATVPEANRALCDASAAELRSGAVPDDSIWKYVPARTSV